MSARPLSYPKLGKSTARWRGRRASKSLSLASVLLAVARITPHAGVPIAILATQVQHASAQSRPTVVSSLSARRVEVGESFEVRLQARADEGSFAAPQLAAPSGFRVSGPSTSRQEVMQFGPNGGSVQVDLTATWTLIPEKTGRFSISGPTIRWNGERIKTSGMSIEVVESTGRRPRPPSLSFPFGPGGSGFSFQFHWPFGSQLDDEDDVLTDKSLALAEPIQPHVFLRAVADKTDAVVGEQVTISFYVYSHVDVQMSDRQEAPLSDFLRVPLIKSSQPEPTRAARVGGQIYSVRLLDRVAAFPLRAGDLSTGSMQARMTGRRVGTNVARTSPPITIRVTQPPTDGRPAGYTVGDVGKFSLTSSVAPRTTTQGGTVAVSLKVSGEGNFPQRLRVPARTGVEWLDPERKDAIEPREGKVAGSRTFNYVVRLSEGGAVDLGTVELPYWDPETKRFEITRAELGAVEVTPAAPSAMGTSGRDDGPEPAIAPLAKLPPARTSMQAFEPPVRRLATSPWFFLALVVPPLAVVLGSVTLKAAHRARERARTTKGSPAVLAAKALTEVDRAAEARDVKKTAAASERAIHAVLEDRTGLRARGVLLANLRSELTGKGLPDELALRACELLDDCANVGYAPSADRENPAADLAARAHALCEDLKRRRRA